MDYTILITRFLGIVFAVYGLALLFNKSQVQEASGELTSNKGLSFAVGMVQLFWGSFFVVVQQVWTTWSVMTTLAGWFVFLSGVCRLWMPGCANKCTGKSCGALAFFGFIIFAWGILMMFYGFFGNLHNMMAAVHHLTGSGAAPAN